jgi:KDO2-lipid IV(A) lauroyltransferase
VSRENPSPLDLLPAVNALRRGEYVAIAADRRWAAEQQLVDVRFAGHRVSLPAAPFALPHLGRAPVYQFFALRTGPNRLFATLIPLTAGTGDAGTRAERIQRTAQEYTDHLEAMARRYPESWYHFEPFLGPRIADGESS